MATIDELLHGLPKHMTCTEAEYEMSDKDDKTLYFASKTTDDNTFDIKLGDKTLSPKNISIPYYQGNLLTSIANIAAGEEYALNPIPAFNKAGVYLVNVRVSYTVVSGADFTISLRHTRASDSRYTILGMTTLHYPTYSGGHMNAISFSAIVNYSEEDTLAIYVSNNSTSAGGIAINPNTYSTYNAVKIG